MLSVLVLPTGAVVAALCVRAGRRVGASSRVDALRVRRRWRLPTRVRGRLTVALAGAEVFLEPEQAVEYWSLATLAAAVVALSFSPTFVVVVVVAAVLAPAIGLRVAQSRHERRFAAALPGALDVVAAELRGGGTVPQAVERLAESRSPVAADLRRVAARARLGLTWADAFAGWPRDHDADGVRAAAGALAVATTMGGRAADAIDGLASSLRHRLDAVAEGRALSSQARMSAVVVGAAPLGYLAFSALVDPGAVDALVGTALGRGCLLVGLGLETLAALWIRRIVRSEG